ncbi:MAG: thioredoxin [Candidatus Omnitrophota bacterium]
MAIIHLNNDNFKKEVIDASGSVLVDFYADWCGPCKMVGPILQELANEYEGKVKICKVNVDGAQEVASEYGVMSIPTMIYFKDGKKVNQTVGALPKDQIKENIKKFL